jgi:hypothetical protein
MCLICKARLANLPAVKPVKKRKKDAERNCNTPASTHARKRTKAVPHAEPARASSSMPSQQQHVQDSQLAESTSPHKNLKKPSIASYFEPERRKKNSMEASNRKPKYVQTQIREMMLPTSDFGPELAEAEDQENLIEARIRRDGSRVLRMGSRSKSALIHIDSQGPSAKRKLVKQPVIQRQTKHQNSLDTAVTSAVTYSDCLEAPTGLSSEEEKFPPARKEQTSQKGSFILIYSALILLFF